MAEAEDGVVRLDPMLLQGSPGVGKSFFCEEFARLLGSEITRINMETAQENSALAGSADYWSNTKPGRVFETLVFKEFANAVVVVEEIEKASTYRNDPLNALLGLMEKKTAESFFDQSYPWLTVDASWLIWVCTSNDADVLPAPILSRLRRFDIPDPTEKQSLGIVRWIFGSICSEFPNAARDIELTAEAEHLLVKLSPRRAKLELKAALGRAIYHSRNQISGDDISHPKSADNDRRIGFS